MTRKRVAIVGGAGRLGRYIVDEMESRHDIKVLDKVRGDLPHETAIVDITRIGDLRDALKGVDAVIHVAGIDGHVDASAEDFFKVNLLGTWNVLQASVELGISKVIVTSSTAATGLNMREPTIVPLYLPIDEEHPLLPTDPYGIGKQFIEIMAENFSLRHVLAVTCIRPTYIAFPDLIPHLKGETGPVGPDTPAAFREAPPLLRTYVDPAELARCYRLAMEQDTSGFEVFWACAADTFEAAPTLDYVRSAYGQLPEIRMPDLYSKGSHAGLIDCSRARRKLGWTHDKFWRDLSSSPDPEA